MNDGGFEPWVPVAERCILIVAGAGFARADEPPLLIRLEVMDDLVVGYRMNRQDKLVTRKIPSRIANWLIGNVGVTCIPGGPCLIPVWPGIMSPSGVLMIGAALVLRDANSSWRHARLELRAGAGQPAFPPVVNLIPPGPYGDDAMRMAIAQYAMAVIEGARLDLRPLVTHRYKLDDIEEAYELFANQRDGVLKVAIKP